MEARSADRAVLEQVIACRLDGSAKADLGDGHFSEDTLLNSASHRIASDVSSSYGCRTSNSGALLLYAGFHNPNVRARNRYSKPLPLLKFVLLPSWRQKCESPLIPHRKLLLLM
jgi:hypothetical protein